LTFNSKDRVLWIDAICINQDDTSEKSHQVRQWETSTGWHLKSWFG
jgi:hypothetical protein